MRDSRLSVVIFIESRDALMSCIHTVFFFSVGILVDILFGSPIPDSSCVWQVDLILRVFRVTEGHLVLAVNRTVSA